MKKIIFKNSDNSICLVEPEDQIGFDRHFKKEMAQETPRPYKVVENIDFLDFEFFKAYEFDQEVAAKVNTSKAKDIWLNHYRTARTPLLEKLDLEYMRADEAGNLELKKEIAAKKQALRDVTKTELPNTLEEIKATWPEILGQNPF
jgi:hypothetical protein